MSRRFEPIAFLLLAVLLHVAALLVVFAQPEAAGGGGGQEGSLGIAGAPGDLAKLVDSWETAPRTAAAPEQIHPPAAEATKPAPSTDAPPVRAETARTLRPSPAPETPPSPREHADLQPLPAPAAPRPSPLPLPDRGPEAPEPPAPPAVEPSDLARLEPPSELAALPDAAPVAPAPSEGPAIAPDETPEPVAKPRTVSRQARQDLPREEPTNAPPPEPEPRQAEIEPAEPARSGGQPSAGGIPGEGSGDAPAAEGAGAAGGGGGPGEADLAQSLGAAVRAAIERQKSYPRRARLRRIDGGLSLSVTISRDGRLLELGVARSSGHDSLDEAALDAARAVGRYPEAPPELSGQQFTFVIPIAFRLR